MGHRHSSIAVPGESFEKPSLTKLRKALSWHLEHRPDWKVLAFVYEAIQFAVQSETRACFAKRLVCPVQRTTLPNSRGLGGSMEGGAS